MSGERPNLQSPFGPKNRLLEQHDLDVCESSQTPVVRQVSSVTNPAAAQSKVSAWDPKSSLLLCS